MEKCSSVQRKRKIQAGLTSRRSPLRQSSIENRCFTIVIDSIFIFRTLNLYTHSTASIESLLGVEVPDDVGVDSHELSESTNT
jgi:hypothetical protein